MVAALAFDLEPLPAHWGASVAVDRVVEWW